MALAQPWFAPLSVTLNSETAQAPFTRPVIEGSRNTVSAPSPQIGAQGRTYEWARWWYGGAQTRTVTVNAPTTYTAAFERRWQTIDPGRRTRVCAEMRLRPLAQALRRGRRPIRLGSLGSRNR